MILSIFHKDDSVAIKIFCPAQQKTDVKHRNSWERYNLSPSPLFKGSIRSLPQLILPFKISEQPESWKYLKFTPFPRSGNYLNRGPFTIIEGPGCKNG
jgi:hypothetical protein